VGYQCAGTIREVGPKVTDRTVGQRVVVVVPSGSHAERVAAPARMSWVVPPGADLTAAACVPVAFGTAHEALFPLGQLTAGQKVLVHAGAGGVGLAAIQLAKAAGATVLTTASADDKLARLKDFGVDHGINYKSQELASAVAKAIGSGGVDLIIDSVGGKTLQDSVACLAYQGRIVNLGVAGRDAVLFNPMPLWGKNGRLIGMSLMTSLRYDYARAYGAIAECIERVGRGELKVVVAKRFALSDAAAAHAYVESRSVFGRVVMRPWGV
jgi:NADPH2:quinone reductase